MAQVLLQGTSFVNFMGKYVYVAEGTDGFEAVAVTESDEPQAVIGSTLHRLAYPDRHARHLDRKMELATSHHHGAGDLRSLQLRGEYLYTANGPDGFRVFDVANVDNKGFSERLVTAPVSPLGQDTHVDTRDATAVALPTNMPVDTRRSRLPENLERPLHPVYSYAFIADREEGLILVDVMTLADGDPRNNFLDRALTYNPEGILDGAVNITLAGNYGYVSCDRGLVIVRFDDPMRPEIVAAIGAPDIVKPVAVAVQFRYAFVVDAEGLKALDVTFPETPRPVPGTIPLEDGQDVVVARTYAYVAAGREGLLIVDVKNPEEMRPDRIVGSEQGVLDARAVRVAATNASLFAYVADGEHGLKVLQLLGPENNPNYLGFSPRPEPKLIAVRHTHGPALALSKGLDRDRAVDESGNQVSVFGRLGSYPFNLDEQRALYVRNGRVWTVGDSPAGGGAR
jgi:hypothetical protein